MTKKLLFIHGGTLAKNLDELYHTMEKREINPLEEKKRWRKRLQQDLPNYQVIIPEMPNKEMASYRLWKMWFEKHLPFLESEELVVVGHSLGGMFLIKYLGENPFQRPIKQLHLVAPALDEQGLPEGDNYLGDFAYENTIIKILATKAEHIFLWHSKDDPVVPFNHSERIKAELPEAQFMIFEDRQHFNQAEFPELIEQIQSSK